MRPPYHFLRLVICFLVFTAAASPCSVQQQAKQPPATEAERLAEIEKLRGVEAKLQEDLSKVQNDLQQVRSQIDLLQRAIAEEQLKLLDSVQVVIASRAYLWSEPSLASDFHEYLEPGQTVEVVEVFPKEGFYKIKHGGSLAFIPTSTVTKTAELKVFEKRSIEVKEKLFQEEEARKNEEEARQRREAEIKRKEAAEARQKLLTTKYGPQIAKRILNKTCWIGMTSDMAIESLGKPIEVNRTVLARGMHEQWVYSDSLYLYFENGVLVSFQDKR